MHLEEFLDEYYSTEDENERIELIAAIAKALKHDIVTILNNIDDVKVKDVITDPKRKIIFIKFYFTHQYLAAKDFIIAIKFSTQKSKPIVPAQIEKYINKIKGWIADKLYRKQYPYDLTYIIIGPKFTKGVSTMRRMIEDGKYFYTATPDTLIEVIENLIDYFRARITAFAEKLAETKRQLNNKGIQGKFDQGIEAIKQLMKVMHALKQLVQGKIRKLMDQDYYEFAVELIEDESNLDNLDNFLR